METKEKISYKYFINDIKIYLRFNEIHKEFDILLYYLLYKIEQGNVCVNLEHLYDSPEEILYIKKLFNYEFTHEKFIDQLKLFLEKISSNEKFKQLFEIYDNQYFYFKKQFDYQKSIKEKLNKILINQKESLLKKYQKQILEYLQPLTKKLNEKQILSILLGLENSLLIISGGPGTGKTTVASHIIGIYLNLFKEELNIGICAPTGRASSRLFESIKDNLIDVISEEILQKIEPMTIHRLLDFDYQKNEFRFNEENPLEYNLIIVDEVSMLDLNLMKSLFDAISVDKLIPKIIFLGDINQLPSVNEGNILSDLIPSENSSFIKKNKIMLNELREKIMFYQESLKIKLVDNFNNPIFVLLTQSFRNKKHIKELADQIIQYNNNLENIKSFLLLKDDEIDSYEFKDENHIVWFSKPDIKIIRNLLKKFIKNYLNNINDDLEKVKRLSKNEWLENQFLIENIYHTLTNIKILCVLKDTDLGTHKINQFLIDELFDAKFPAHGLPLMITKNDYLNNLYNGDLGIFLIDKDKQIWACFPEKEKKGNFLFYHLKSLFKYDPAFAITVHKSQGSEYKNIFVVLPLEKHLTDESRQLLSKQILYTGITRAKDNVYIFSEEKVLDYTIQNQIIRDSGLKFFDL